MLQDLLRDILMHIEEYGAVALELQGAFIDHLKGLNKARAAYEKNVERIRRILFPVHAEWAAALYGKAGLAPFQTLFNSAEVFRIGCFMN